MAIATFRIKVGEQWYTVEVGDLSTSPIQVTVDGEIFAVEVDGLPAIPPPTQRVRPRPRSPERATPPPPSNASPVDSSGGIIRSPMPGRVISIMVRPGDRVSAGDEVCVVEAMKMEQSIRAPKSGVVKIIHVQPMDSVSANDPLMELE